MTGWHFNGEDTCDVGPTCIHQSYMIIGDFIHQKLILFGEFGYRIRYKLIFSDQPYLKAFAQHFGDFGQGLDRWIALGGMLQPLVRLITDAQFPGHLDLWTSSSRFA